MDLRVLLRYQISGSVFIGWFLLFHYSVHSADWADMAKQIMDATTLLTFVASIPIGAIIHQFSVTIKNQFLGLCEGTCLSDSPMKSPTKEILAFYKDKISNEDKTKEVSLEYLNYIKEKISNLNSFYYMRFDNGFLAPALAYMLFFIVDGKIIQNSNIIILTIILLISSVLLISYKYPVIKAFAYITLTILSLSLAFCTNVVILPNSSNLRIELNTQHIMFESNTRYVITNEYSFESSSNTLQESQILVGKWTNAKVLLQVLESNNIQKTSIVESNGGTSENCCTRMEKCTKYLNNSACKPYDVESIGEEGKLYISKAEITKIDPSLLNKFLIACLAISFLLLSYIPRIIQELKEYKDELKEKNLVYVMIKTGKI